MPLRWQEHYQEEISETASVETDDNMGPHPEQAISILWRSETSSNIGGGLVICSICPQTRSVAAARSEEFCNICVLLGRRGAGDGGGGGRCVAYFTRRCMLVDSFSEWLYETIKISQENGVVQRRGCEYWVSLGCWSRFLLGMRA